MPPPPIASTFDRYVPPLFTRSYLAEFKGWLALGSDYGWGKTKAVMTDMPFCGRPRKPRPLNYNVNWFKFDSITQALFADLFKQFLSLLKLQAPPLKPLKMACKNGFWLSPLDSGDNRVFRLSLRLYIVVWNLVLLATKTPAYLC